MIPFLTILVAGAAGWLLFRCGRYLRTPWVPVLCYHHVAEPVDDDPGGLYVGPRRFAEQLALLRRKGCSPVTLDQVYDHVTAGAQLPANPVALTFDDGYLDNWTHAFPLLREYEVPAAIFIITSLVGEGDPRPTLDDVRQGRLSREELDRAAAGSGAGLNWRELSAMRDSGLVTLASHSHAHLDFSRTDSRRAREDVQLSRKLLEERAGGRCLDLAWPYGYRTRAAERTVRTAGYRSAFRISTRLFGGRGNRPGADPLALRRLAVTGDLDLERALDFYHRPSPAGRLRAVAGFIRYHLGRKRGRS